MFFSWCVQLTHKAGAADLSLALSLRLVSWPNFVCSFGFRNEDKQFVKQLTQKSDNLIGRAAASRYRLFLHRFPEGPSAICLPSLHRCTSTNAQVDKRLGLGEVRLGKVRGCRDVVIFAH